MGGKSIYVNAEYLYARLYIKNLRGIVTSEDIQMSQQKVTS
jgi:hypothetical protein